MSTVDPPPELTHKQWRGELERLVQGPIWPTLRAWWQRRCLERAMLDADPMAAVLDQAHHYAGGCALLLALENESTGDIDERSEQQRRAERKAEREKAARAARGQQRGARA